MIQTAGISKERAALELGLNIHTLRSWLTENETNRRTPLNIVREVTIERMQDIVAREAALKDMKE